MASVSIVFLTNRDRLEPYYKWNNTDHMCNAITIRSDVANKVTRLLDASNMTVVPPASL